MAETLKEEAFRQTADADRQLGLLWGGVALLIGALAPIGPMLAELTPRCLFKVWLGIPCPTCGTTRAALALARFDLVHALTHYPLQSLAWIAFLGGGLIAGALAWQRRPLPRLPRNLPLGARLAIVLTVLANWMYSIAHGV